MNVALLATVNQNANLTSSDGGQPASTVILLSVILPLITAVISGGLVTAALQDRHQRIKDLRDSWLTASDDFLVAATSGLVALQQLKPQQDKASGGQKRELRRILRDELELSVGRDWMKDTGDKVAEATQRLRRIQLLFGPKSLAAQDGKICVEQLEKARISIQIYYRTVRAIEILKAGRQVAWRQLAPRQAGPQQIVPRQMAPEGMRPSWGIDWLREARLRFARWLFERWRHGIMWLRWGQVPPPEEAPAEAASESQESMYLDSMMQDITNVVRAISPLIQPGLNLGEYVKRYKDQRTLKDRQQAADTDYENAVREAEKSLGEFVNRVSEEIDGLQPRPRAWPKKK